MRRVDVVTGAVFAASLLAAFVPAALTSSPGNADETLVFEHEDHVSTGWREQGERLRDCRGCHVFGAGSPEPQAACVKCHFHGTFDLAAPKGVDASFATSLAALRSDDSPVFDHFQHDRLACAECHAPAADRKLDPLPVRRGVAECARCHAPGAPVTRPASGKGEEPLSPERFYASIDANESMKPSRLGPFEHRDHLLDPTKCLAPADLLDAAPKERGTSCVPCHATAIRAPAAGFHGALFDSESCRECHRTGAADEPTLRAAARADASRALLTFSHADHVKASLDAKRKRATGVAYDAIAQQSCLACHEHGASDRRTSPEGYGFRRSGRPAADSYEGCVACHDVAEWMPKLHDHWADRGCVVCHAFGGGDMKRDRPTVDVARSRPKSFRIASQAHPDITVSGDASPVIAEDCAECHRAPVSGLPSRLQEKPFSHATHLRDSPAATDCTPCHAAKIDGTNGSAEILESYDVGACRDCHKSGLEPVLRSDVAAGATEPIVSFPHQPHLRAPKTGDAKTCLDCHRPDERGGGADFATSPEALACTSCHDHGPSRFRATGGADLAEVSTCRKCHHDPADRERCVVPKPDATAAAVDRAFVEAAGTQAHPRDRACAKCHTGGIETVPPVDHVQATVGRFRDPSRIGGRPIAEVHRSSPGEGNLLLKPVDQNLCVDCHWRQRQSDMTIDPTDASVRRSFGDDLAGFPGWPEWPGHSRPPR